MPLIPRRMDSCETVSEALEQSSTSNAADRTVPLPSHLTASSIVCSTARQVSLLRKPCCLSSRWRLSSRKSFNCDPTSRSHTSAAAQRMQTVRYIAVSLLLPFFVYREYSSPSPQPWVSLQPDGCIDNVC